MSLTKSYAEINEKLKNGKAVVCSAEEVSRMSEEKTPKEILKEVDVVTTGTFGAMCSSGIFMNFGHADPPLRMQKVTLNKVPAYTGVASVDAYLGASEESPLNSRYGGAHVIQELIEGKDIVLEASGRSTDCYPNKEIKTTINKDNVNEIIMFNPRNAYQNYNVAVNSTNKIKYTYMGNLLPNFGNGTYSTSGELSPLLNDPRFRTIGVGTPIFLGGATGYVAWNGTQFNTGKPKNERGIPIGNSGTIAVIGNLKEMNSRYIQAAYFEKYGVSIFIGIGIPIPILDEDMAFRVSVRNDQIHTNIIDYGVHPMRTLGQVDYATLRSGTMRLQGKRIRVAPVSSLYRAREIAEELKQWLMNKRFSLNEPVKRFEEHDGLNSLEIRGERS